MGPHKDFTNPTSPLMEAGGYVEEARPDRPMEKDAGP